jgi:lipoprotein NlpD
MKTIKYKILLSFRFSIVVAVLFLVACASQKGSSGYLNKAPVEDRGTGIGIGPSKPPLGIENAGKLGYYSVKSGDTLIRIGLDNGQNWRDIARWNQLDRPSQIEVGQVLRVVPPVGIVTLALAAAPQSVVIATPVPTPGAGLPSAVVMEPTSMPVVGAKVASTDDLNWMWPTTSGAVLAGFDESKNKGLDLGGKTGDAVLAALDGRVVYAGAGLRGYGNLVILKHNDTFLSAYAHNQTLLVKEDQSVVKGQKIAEMGQSDSDKVKLHFEIRKQGKPVDPAQYLPKR